MAIILWHNVISVVYHYRKSANLTHRLILRYQGIIPCTKANHYVSGTKTMILHILSLIDVTWPKQRNMPWTLAMHSRIGLYAIETLFYAYFSVQCFILLMILLIVVYFIIRNVRVVLPLEPFLTTSYRNFVATFEVRWITFVSFIATSLILCGQFEPLV